MVIIGDRRCTSHLQFCLLFSCRYSASSAAQCISLLRFTFDYAFDQSSTQVRRSCSLKCSCEPCDTCPQLAIYQSSVKTLVDASFAGCARFSSSLLLSFPPLISSSFPQLQRDCACIWPNRKWQNVRLTPHRPRHRLTPRPQLHHGQRQLDLHQPQRARHDTSRFQRHVRPHRGSARRWC